MLYGTALFWIVALVFPMHEGYPDSARVTEMMTALSPARNAVTTSLTSGAMRQDFSRELALIPETTEIRTKDSSPVRFAFKEIDESGEIKVFSPELGVMLRLIPASKNGDLSWIGEREAIIHQHRHQTLGILGILGEIFCSTASLSPAPWSAR